MKLPRHDLHLLSGVYVLDALDSDLTTPWLPPLMPSSRSSLVIAAGPLRAPP